MKILCIVLALLLTGCATGYEQYVAAQVAIETARANAEAEKYKAIAKIAESGSDAAKVAAVMSLDRGTSQQPSGSGIRAPESFGETALRWAGLLTGPIVQAYGIRSNAQVSMRQSDNAAVTSVATFNAFSTVAGKMQAPVSNVTNIGGNGVIGAGTYSTVDRHDTTANSNSFNPTSESYNPVRNCVGTGAPSGTTGAGGAGAASC